MLFFCPLCPLCFKGASKRRTRARRKSGRGRTHEEKYCPQWLFSASQWRNKNRTTKLPPDAKEGRSEQKTNIFKRRRDRKGEAKEKGKRVEAGFEVREKAVLREWRRVFKREQEYSRKNKKVLYTTPRRNKNKSRKKAQKRAKAQQKEQESILYDIKKK